MSRWGPTSFGDPCRECGYGWSLSLDEALASMSAIPGRYGRLVVGCDGSERSPELGWCVSAYVCHVTDNLRIWAERLAAAALAGATTLTGYDNELLAIARAYESVPLPGALWSLGRAVTDWCDAIRLADEAGVTLEHPDRGEITVLDVSRTNTHDARHHARDIERILMTSRRHGSADRR